MYFLLSGEGPTDLGSGTGKAGVNEGENFSPGPMAVIVDQVVETKLKYSMFDIACCGFISEVDVASRAGELKAAKKQLRLPGKRQAKETRYFFNHARLLSRIARDHGKKCKDEVVAVLFRDADGTASAGRGLWDDKWQSIIDGFDEEDFIRGVPMVPKPKSEAWLICALKKAPYQNCTALEDRSGNDNSPKSLKAELAAILEEEVTSELLCEAVRAKLSIDRIKMPSFKAFRDRLEEAIDAD